MLTLAEIKEKIVEQVAEVDFIDLLGLTTQDLVNAFEDRLEEKLEEMIDTLDLPEEVEE